MDKFLISQLTNDKDVEIDNSNHLAEELGKSIKGRENFVFVASFPSGFEKTDFYANLSRMALEKHGIKFKNMVVLDDRTRKNVKNIVETADFLFLTGGVTTIQNKFLQEIDLAKHIKNCRGVIAGQSAGAMNMASIVYDYPEDVEEIGQPKFFSGLGLTNINIIPHFDEKTGNVQGDESIDLMNDYLLKDTKNSNLQLLCVKNGSFIKISGETATAFGETYLIKNGKISKVCSNGEQKFLSEKCSLNEKKNLHN